MRLETWVFHNRHFWIIFMVKVACWGKFVTCHFQNGKESGFLWNIQYLWKWKPWFHHEILWDCPLKQNPPTSPDFSGIEKSHVGIQGGVWEPIRSDLQQVLFAIICPDGFRTKDCFKTKKTTNPSPWLFRVHTRWALDPVINGVTTPL